MLYSHCGFAEILSCYGIVGFIVFYKAFYHIIRRFVRLTHKDGYIVFVFLYALLTLFTEASTIAFITPQVVVLLTAALCLISKQKDDELYYIRREATL